MDKFTEQTQNLSTQQLDQLSHIDFSKIPSSDEFQKIKVKPPRRWFNSLMTLSLSILGITLGVTVALVIAHFA
jgi:hypothetical protein